MVKRPKLLKAIRYRMLWRSKQIEEWQRSKRRLRPPKKGWKIRPKNKKGGKLNFGVYDANKLEDLSEVDKQNGKLNNN